MDHEGSAGADEGRTGGPGTAGDPQFAAARLKERIYATITIISVVIGLRSAAHVGPAGAASALATTAVGLWLAAIVADQQAHRVVHGRLAGGRELRGILAVSSPLLLSAVGPLVLVGAAALGVMSVGTALLAAAVVSVTGLFVWGCYGGVRMGGGVVAALLAGALDAAIGLAVALVKASAGH
ncbi:hypothetical protein [Streptomyces sp. NBC_00158]|uniref:hypothetical protein n=1 Tax=Streptomyces sp. NBC_00158 TaxID=2903627 RepID=UPI0032503B84